jgi:hypothetical protein
LSSSLCSGVRSPNEGRYHIVKRNIIEFGERQHDLRSDIVSDFFSGRWFHWPV